MVKTFHVHIILTFAIIPVLAIAQVQGRDSLQEDVLRFFNEKVGVKLWKSPALTSKKDKKNQLPELQNRENLYAVNLPKGDSPGNIFSGDVYDKSLDLFLDADVSMKGVYGKSFFTDKKYKQYDEDRPLSRVIKEGFFPEQIIKLRVNGTIDRRISVYIDHDSERDENTYRMNYRAIEDDEFIREVNVGEIDINFDHSNYATYDNTRAKGLGADFKVRKGSWEFMAFGSIITGNSEVEVFRGNSRQGSISLRDYQYVRNVYYQLEPFLRYDGLTSPPGPASVYSTIAITSSPADPENYSLHSVNINPAGFAVYMDDRNPHNDANTITLSLDGGNYKKLANGIDYSINYSTGLIKFLSMVPEDSRIFAVYTLSGGTRDPSVLVPGDIKHPGGEFAGKNFVFIRYGESLNEDTEVKNLSFDTGEVDSNGDGKVNLDVYEVKSFYYLGERGILPDNFFLTFYDDSSRMKSGDRKKLGKYFIDFESGLLRFKLREPFRFGLSQSAIDVIYSEVLSGDAYLFSRYKMVADFFSGVRSFKLKHGNIVKDSVSVKVNGSKLSTSLYSVNSDFGMVYFIDSNNPLISSTTKIEISYDYLPEGTSGSGFAGGARTEYSVNRNLKLGGSVVLARGAGSEVVPEIGEESGQTIVFEGDASLRAGSKNLSNIYNKIAGGAPKNIPLEFSAYGEFARSIQNKNTFGKALLDNMESTVEIVSISLSEKDWQLSSMPLGLNQSNRGILNYYYYRRLSSTDILRGESFSPARVDYEVKPGPFNIATGHVDSSITDKDDQISLVFDYDFTMGNCVSAVTRQLSEEALDFSGLKYVELWVRHDSSAGGSVNLYMDIGRISEDADGDGIFDTEDSNGNGYIDAYPKMGISEDRGFSFDGNNHTVIGGGPGLSRDTRGDGRLNSEDLNGDGRLETEESVVTVNLGSLAVDNGKWKKIRVYIDWESLSGSEVALMREVQSLRLYMVKNSGDYGRVFFDGIRFLGSKWRDAQIDGLSTNDPGVIKAGLLNTVDDEFYRGRSFLHEKRGVYESLYGSLDSSEFDEEQETTLQLDFNIPGVNNAVSIKRTFPSPIDIGYYKTLNLWMKAISFTSNASMGIILGSSDYDYREYRIGPSTLNSWENFTLKLDSSSNGNVPIFSTTGIPNLKRITFLKVVFYGAGESGTVWLNDIYVSDPITHRGNAWLYENTLKFKKALYRTKKGVPVLSDMNLKYIEKGNTSKFENLGRSNGDMSRRYRKFAGKFKILPRWDASLVFAMEHYNTDGEGENFSRELAGETRINRFNFITDYISQNDRGPRFNFQYMLNDYDNIRSQKLGGSVFDDHLKRVTHSPSLKYVQTIEDFLFGTLRADVVLHLVFKELSTGRSSQDLSNSELSSYINLHEEDRRQRSDLNLSFEYLNPYFYFKPGFGRSLEEIVDFENGDSQNSIDGEVHRGFHFPFFVQDPGKYVSRNNYIDLELGYLKSNFWKPAITFKADYREYDFRDHDFDTTPAILNFTRTKSALSTFYMKLYLPMRFGRSGILKRVKNLNLSYSRESILSETFVPYEGESDSLFHEEYGLPRVFSSLSPVVYNLYKYYPGYFFHGHGNYARGRDIVYESLNRRIRSKGSSLDLDYDNSLKFDDDLALDSNIDLGVGNINLNLGLKQVVERSNIEGIPGQIVTYRAGSFFRIDLMKLLNFGFFRKNGKGADYHSSSLNMGLAYNDSEIITANINEKSFSPEISINFKWGRQNLLLSTALDYRRRSDAKYIDRSIDEGKSDYIYAANMPEESNLKEEDHGYRFRILYDTEVKDLFKPFSSYYKLTGIPTLSLEYRGEINRYDYINAISPEPYDLHSLKAGLMANVHKYVKAEIDGAVMLERFYNRDEHVLASQVFSLEVAAKMSFLF